LLDRVAVSGCRGFGSCAARTSGRPRRWWGYRGDCSDAPLLPLGGLLGRGDLRTELLELELLVGANFGVVSALVGGMGTNLGIELNGTAVNRHRTTGLSSDPVWRAVYSWNCRSMPDEDLAAKTCYSDDDPSKSLEIRPK
jgi:hypothetical protein